MLDVILQTGHLATCSVCAHIELSHRHLHHSLNSQHSVQAWYTIIACFCATFAVSTLSASNVPDIICVSGYNVLLLPRALTR